MITNMFFQFLLLPLLALCMTVPLFLIKKKNSLLANKTLVVFILLNIALIAIVGLLGIMGNNFSPWGYLAAQLIFCVMGIVFVQLYEVYINRNVANCKALTQILIIAIIIVLGGYLMATVFNLVSEVQSGYIAASALLIFPLPLLFYMTYLALIKIPVEIYDVWRYPLDAVELNIEGFDFNKLMVLKIELSKKLYDKDRLRLMVKGPDVIQLGAWFRMFIDDYNTKNSADTIEYIDDEGLSYGWIFYYKHSFLHRRRLLDPEKSIRENLVKEHVTIIAKRVIEHSEEVFYKNNN
ncbi:TssN family type VI secretion system protein [Danxiaibacter flavus]|uniref:TssN family type VI secretion system protein n=1 Tax=Danxiaibacter flavus TaxID=3049108 RepID=A0ABV3ZCQ1_9BACT|nr:TssN family type VI secretion system protein [Chitinophagaceae bacterium DXS]